MKMVSNSLASTHSYKFKSFQVDLINPGNYKIQCQKALKSVFILKSTAT